MGEQERRDKNSLRAYPLGSGSNTAPSLPSLLERASFWGAAQVQSREHQRDTASLMSVEAQREVSCPKYTAMCWPRRGLFLMKGSRKKNRLENSRRERSREERNEGRKEYRKGLLFLSH